MINKLTGEPVSEEMQNVLKRLAVNEAVPESEIYALKEIKEANSCISSSKPTIELRNRTGIQLGVYNRLQNMGSAVTKSDGAVSFSGEIRREKRLDIVIGLPASSKSSALVEPISELYKSRLIDSDEAKKLLPEFNNGWGASVVHEHVYGKYIFEVEKNRYSVTYAFSDVTYDAADAAEQERIFLAYGDLLNSFDTSDDIQITLHNNVINQKEFSSQILLKHAGDGFDEYRDEYNEMLLDKMQQGQNGITTKKYFTVTVTAATLELAQQKLAAKELYMRSCFQKIGSNIEKLKANERIRIIADIFRGVNQEIRPISSSEFLRGAEKSLCCPDYFEFKKDYFMYNDKFARMVYLKHLPSSLVDDMLKDLCETSLPIVVTVNIAPVEPSEAIKVVKRQLTAMRSNKMQKEKKASQHGVYSDVISDDLKQSLAEAEELLNDLQSKNQKMFLLNLVVMVTGTSFDELDNNTDKIEAVFRKHVCTTSRANFQQEDAMASCLPLGNCRLKVRRTLTTESACVFMPFNSKELSQKGGVYYGLNQTTNNLIIFNRASLINANGFILGCPGSGKSFSAKREMVNVFLWDKIVRNRERGIRTRIYIDEIYLLFRNEESANFLFELYKRARKWGGIPTGITQNVEDLLKSDTARSMLSNSEFILMLNQAASDRDKLSHLLKIPENMMSFVTGAPAGSGLIYCGLNGSLPFKDDFPTDTKLYKLMTTKFGE